MNTSDPAIAEDRARPFITMWKREFKEMLAEPQTFVPVNDTPTPADLMEAAVIMGHDIPLQEMREGRQTLKRAHPSIWRANVRYYEMLRDERARDAATGNTDAAEALADEAIDALGWQGQVPKGSSLYEQFCELITKANLAALNTAMRHNAGDLEAETDSKLVREVRERQAVTAKAGETILELFERYASQRAAEKRKRADTINQDRKVIEGFAEFVGSRRKASTITDLEVRDWIDTLAVLPPNFTKMKAYRGLTLREAAKKARLEGASGLKPTTLNKYLSTLSPLFKWMKKRNYYASANPCDGLFYDVPKGSNPRPPFTTEQLNTILKSPLFTGFQGDGKEHLQGNCRADDWRYWVPLACLFTGARLGEIAQLRIEDVRKERGVWFMHIVHDESTGQTTKSGFSRAAPIHSKLIQLGFLQFHDLQVKRAATDANLAMFPELEKNARGQMSGMVGRWWRDYLKDIGIKAKKGADGFGSHSFRHTMADRLRDEAELLDDEIEVTLGHNQKTTTSGYGRLKQGTVTRLQRYFEAVRFEGVDFSPLSG